MIDAHCCRSLISINHIYMCAPQTKGKVPAVARCESAHAWTPCMRNTNGDTCMMRPFGVMRTKCARALSQPSQPHTVQRIMTVAAWHKNKHYPAGRPVHVHDGVDFGFIVCVQTQRRCRFTSCMCACMVIFFEDSLLKY